MSNPYLKPVKLVIFTYIAFSVISFLYSLITGNYNGDFLDCEVNLNWIGLLVALIICIIPNIILYDLYKYFAKIRYRKYVSLRMDILEPMVIVIFILHILLGFLFGVGRAGGDEYNVPPIVKPIIQVMIRVSPSLWGTILLMIIQKRQYKKVIIICFLFCVLGVARAAFGFIASIAVVLFVKYYQEIVRWIKRHRLSVIVSLMTMPAFVRIGYEMRSALRGDGYETPKNASTLICGKLIGRLSSFSNTAVLIEKAPLYLVTAKEVDNCFFFKGLGSAISRKFALENRPEKILMLDENVPENASFILGSGGILVFSFYNSPNLMIINAFAIVFVCLIVFRLCSMFKNPLGSTIAVIVLLGPILSGVAGEYSLICICICIAIFLIALINNLIHLIKSNRKYGNKESDIC